MQHGKRTDVVLHDADSTWFQTSRFSQASLVSSAMFSFKAPLTEDDLRPHATKRECWMVRPNVARLYSKCRAKVELNSVWFGMTQALHLKCVPVNLDRKQYVKVACFLKLKQEMTGKGCQNHAIVQPLNCILWAQKNHSWKIYGIKKKDLAISCLLKGSTSILVLRRSEVRLFCDKMRRPFLPNFSRHLLENPSRYLYI